MSHPITIPIFGTEGRQRQSSSDSDLFQGMTQQGGGDNDMDFDLLAEYLLEENSSDGIGMNFDYNPHSGTGSTVVSPEQSVDSIKDSGAVPGRFMFAQHPNSISNSDGNRKSQPRMVFSAENNMLHPPSNHPVPQIAAQGINVPTPIPQLVSLAPVPDPMIAPMGGITAINVSQQPGVVVTKRRRADPQAMSGTLQSSSVLADPAAVAGALDGRGRKKTQVQIDRRRERNRILARRTRLRKKFYFESLQKEVIDLQRENVALKDIVRSQVSEEEAAQLLEQCDATEKLPQEVLETCGELSNDMDQQDFNLIKSIQQSQHSFVITDPSLQDNPIVFASDDFLSLTGYCREDILGRNCRFLQGSETSKDKVDEIRKGLSAGEDVSVTLVNYTAEGVPFWNKLFIAALRDAQNNIVNFIGVVVKVSSPDPNDPEFGKMIEDSIDDPDDLEMDAEGVVEAIEGAFDAAAAAPPSVLSA